MLAHLNIRNYALIDQLDLDFAAGFTVLTGETGAGKSILVEALGLALGDRADIDVIRQGADRAEVAATITLGNNEAARCWLADQELDSGIECVLRRTVSADGRSKAFINGSAVPLASLRALGSLLIDIHGQHEHHSLLGRDHQGELLDGYAEHRALTDPVAASCKEWRRLDLEIREIEVLVTGTGGQTDLLRYQVGEIEGLRLADGELGRLDEEHKRLANAGQIMDACRAGLDTLREDEDAIGNRIARLIPLLRQGAQVDAGLKTAVELLEGATIQLDEAAGELRGCLQRLDLDPQRLDQIDRRLTAIHDLARKHRVRPEELSALQGQLQEKLRSLEGADTSLQDLRATLEQVERTYKNAAAALTTSRVKAAQALEREVTREMRKLGMPEGRFSIELEQRSDSAPAPAGQERTLFLVNTNPQQQPKPLAKVASGGELSRIGLAIQMVTAEQTGIPTIIFDEVDVGIGGRVSEIVGQGLRRLGSRRQVLCITHLPQVAALGHHHLQVTKTTTGRNTAILIRSLSRTERSEEIARMLGGIEISAKTRAHAEEMIKRSEECTEP